MTATTPASWTILREIGIRRLGPQLDDLGEPRQLVTGPNGELVLVCRRADADVLLSVEPNDSPRLLAPGLAGSRIVSLKSDEQGYVAVLGDRRIVMLSPAAEIVEEPSVPATRIATPMAAVRVGQLVVVADWPVGDVRSAGATAIDHAGQVVWQWRPGVETLAEAVDISIVGDLAIVTDSVHCRLTALDLTSGEVVWQYGRRGTGSGQTDLLAPRATNATPWQTLLVADTRNDRVIEIDRSGLLVRHWASTTTSDGTRRGPLSQPLGVTATGPGSVAVADTGNRRVVVLGSAGEEHWSVPRRSPACRSLSFPRSASRLGADHFLVADTNNNRVVEIDNENRISWSFSTSAETGVLLDWPRCAIRTPQHTTWIANGVGGQILQLDRAGRPVTILDKVRRSGGPPVAFSDPHDLVCLDDGSILVVDTGLEAIIRCSPDGELLAQFRAGEVGWGDPHQVLRTTHGWLVAHENGLGLLSPRLEARDTIGALGTAIGPIALRHLKALARSPGGGFFASGTFDGTDGLLAIPWAGRPGRAHLVTHVRRPGDGALDALSVPRFIDASDPRRILLSDYGGHRLLEIAVPDLWPSAGGPDRGPDETVRPDWLW